MQIQPNQLYRQTFMEPYMSGIITNSLHKPANLTHSNCIYMTILHLFCIIIEDTPSAKWQGKTLKGSESLKIILTDDRHTNDSPQGRESTKY